MSKDEEGMRKILSAVACLAVAEKISDPSSWLPREDFPDSFQIPVSDTQAYRQFGNSVVVPVVQAIADAMIDFYREGTK